MKLKCPCCGAVGSLEMWLANDDARAALLAAFTLSGELGLLMVRYIGLFRPEKTELTFARVAKLTNELLPHINSQRLPFDGKLFDAPTDAWIYAMNEMLRTREAGKIKLPLPNHNYLYRIVSGYKAPVDGTEAMPNSPQPTAPTSQMEAGVAALQGMKRGRR